MLQSRDGTSMLQSRDGTSMLQSRDRTSMLQPRDRTSMLQSGDRTSIEAQLHALGSLKSWAAEYPVRVGTSEGRVEYRRGSEDIPRPVMHFRLPLGTVPPFLMDLRPQTAAEQRAIERGHAVDVELGDAGFDRDFVVEAAPSEVIRVLLDAPLRAELRALAPCRLTLVASELHLSRPWTVARWTAEEIAALARMVRLCVQVGERIHLLPVEMARGGHRGGYRGATLTATGECEAAAAAQVTALMDSRRRRRRQQDIVWSLLFGGLLLGLVLLSAHH
jgi:hypothetical protein